MKGVRAICGLILFFVLCPLWRRGLPGPFRTGLHPPNGLQQQFDAFAVNLPGFVAVHPLDVLCPCALSVYGASSLLES